MRQLGVSRQEGDRQGKYCKAHDLTELLDFFFFLCKDDDALAHAV